jgi:hypothetical protein
VELIWAGSLCLLQIGTLREGFVHPFVGVTIALIGAGNKCKFSHDPNVGRKVDKVNIYEDQREDKKKGELARGHCRPTLRPWIIMDCM